MKNTYLVKITKQTFKIGDQVIMWWIPACIQGKFMLRHRGSFKIVSILKNGIYKLANKHGTLKATSS